MPTLPTFKRKSFKVSVFADVGCGAHQTRHNKIANSVNKRKLDQLRDHGPRYYNTPLSSEDLEDGIKFKGVKTMKGYREREAEARDISALAKYREDQRNKNRSKINNLNYIRF